MHKLEVTLKQHTPLIHFQHDQEGATLRASEVKPKLDKFIKTKLKELSPDVFQKYKHLIEKIPDEHNKVNSPYKLSIQLSDESAIDKYVIGSFIPRYTMDDYRRQGLKILDKTPYFADNKPIKDGFTDKDGHKLGLMLRGENHLILTFRFWATEWKTFLQEVIPLFFSVTNFGTRQDKGFGCFLPIDVTRQKMEDFLSIFSRNAFYRSTNPFDMANAFIEIDKIYKTLKSGGQRTESELRKYFNNLRPMKEWEKPAIQEKIEEISRQRLRINSKTNKRLFVRAVLGLPEIYEYPKNRMKVQVKSKNDDIIERYASPLTFKVIDGYIYLYITQRESKITDKTFGFEFNNDGRNYGENLSLITPNEFDIVAFLNEAMSHQRSWKKI